MNLFFLLFFKAPLSTLPSHWMKHFFLAHTYLEQQLNDAALEVYFLLQQNGFEKSSYITAQTAIASHNRRGNVINIYIIFNVNVLYLSRIVFFQKLILQ